MVGEGGHSEENRSNLLKYFYFVTKVLMCDVMYSLMCLRYKIEYIIIFGDASSVKCQFVRTTCFGSDGILKPASTERAVSTESSRKEIVC